MLMDSFPLSRSLFLPPFVSMFSSLIQIPSLLRSRLRCLSTTTNSSTTSLSSYAKEKMIALCEVVIVASLDEDDFLATLLSLSSEEVRVIAEKAFYLATPRDSEPRLMSLLPVTDLESLNQSLLEATIVLLLIFRMICKVSDLKEAAQRVGEALVKACVDLNINEISSYDRNGFARGERMRAFEIAISSFGFLSG